MDIHAVLQQLDEERRSLARDGEIIEILPHVTRIRSADNSRHSVIDSAFTATDAHRVISEQLEHYRKLGVGFEWKVYTHDSPTDLCARLEGFGFQIEPAEAVMVYDLADSPAWLSPEPERPVVRVDHVDQVAEYQNVAELIFNKRYDFTAAELTAALNAGSTQHRGYIGYLGQTPATIGRLYTHPKSYFGGLYGGGTIPEYRGQGLYRANVAARARDAILAGAKYLIVDALPTSRPILERMGFQQASETWPCTWEPDKSSAPA